jgi:hypothetical protein
MAIFKKSSRKLLPHETSGAEKLFKRLLVALITVVVLGGFWLLSQLGPKDVDFRNFDFTVELSDSIKSDSAREH